MPARGRPGREAGQAGQGLRRGMVALPRRLLDRALRRPLAFHLGLFSAALLLPVLLLAGIFTWVSLKDRERNLHEHTLRTADRLMAVLEEELAGQVAALQVLAESPTLDLPELPDLPAFQRQSLAVERLLGGEIRLRPPPAAADATQAEPSGGIGAMALLAEQVAETRQPARSGLVALPGGRFAVFLMVPVLRDGRLRHLLQLQLSPGQFRTVLEQPLLPPGWVATLVDGEGRVIARSADHAQHLGRRISPETQRNALARQGVWTTFSVGGEPLLVAHVSSRQAGWRVGVTVPVAQANAPARHSLLLLALAGSGVLLIAALLAALAARGIAAPVRRLAEAAHRLGRGEAVMAGPLPIRELHEVGRALAAAGIALRSRSQALAESEALLARALHAAQVATWEWQPASDYYHGSPGREAMYGRPRGSLRDRASVLAAAHPEDRPLLAAAQERCLRPGADHYEATYRTIWPDGRIRWLHSQGAVLERDAEGRPLRVSGVLRDVTESRRAAERERLLAAEVDHRARNVLAVVLSMLQLSRADDAARYAEAVRGRVAALARAHTLLSRERWDGSNLLALAREVLGAQPGGARITLQGPPLALAAHAVQPLSMVLHELSTNAAQHGALSRAEGHVTLAWRLQEGRLLLEWQEHGGPPAPPPAPGFGLKVVQATVRRQLAGMLELNWGPEGLGCRISLPLSMLQEGMPLPQARRAG